MYQISEVKLLDYFFIISFDNVMPNFNKTMIYHFKTSRIPRRSHKGEGNLYVTCIKGFAWLKNNISFLVNSD